MVGAIYILMGYGKHFAVANEGGQRDQDVISLT